MGKKDPVKTIRAHQSTLDLLNDLRIGNEDNEDIILRLILKRGQTFFKLISVDGDPPLGHEIIFQMADSPDIPIFYKCKDGINQELNLREYRRLKAMRDKNIEGKIVKPEPVE